MPLIEPIKAANGGAIAAHDPAWRVSQTILTLFVEAGTTQFNVKELATRAGVSERTFYRYFPRKEDVVRPVLSAGANQLSVLLAARPGGEPLLDAIKGAFEQSWWGESTHQSQVLRRLMHETDVLRAIWLDIISETESCLAKAVAGRTSDSPDSARVRLIASVICAVIRSSASVCSNTGDPHALADAFARDLDQVAAGLFAAP